MPYANYDYNASYSTAEIVKFSELKTYLRFAQSTNLSITENRTQVAQGFFHLIRTIEEDERIGEGIWIVLPETVTIVKTAAQNLMNSRDRNAERRAGNGSEGADNSQTAMYAFTKALEVLHGISQAVAKQNRERLEAYYGLNWN